MPQPNKIITGSEADTAGLYIHIPFCKKACIYCNFHFSTSLKYKKEMLAAISRDIILNRYYTGTNKIGTIYLGGGTPSLLSADDLKLLFDTINENSDTSSVTEITLEANPDDLSKTYLRELRSTPVNRLSIGVQSFYERDLVFMQRAHTASQSEYAIKAAQDAGFGNLTIDLIYGIPGLTDSEWKKNIETVQQLAIPHFSAYALTVEERTALHHFIMQKKVTPVDAGQAAGQFELLMEYSAGFGFEHYEISNFAQPGHYAVHNTNYWMGLPYLGAGPSAHSFNGKTRRANIANNALYIKGIEVGKPNFEEETLTDEQQLNEYIMTSLRTMWGTNLNSITQKWGANTTADLLEKASKYIENGKVAVTDNHLILSAQGKLFADGIAGDLFF